ncbi:predicted protein [Scheffersomyces stipitis CBS 6054]|uniref:DASH complex subunit DAD3 n=1 Tax=Scheffersomyces stipitis (strain ATCC 58785 / CBS 6054 / NBRC 10063 / NRRL Y-11545) TaxID=322104 RepID=A3LXY6_PICST|nr:predicted protein [Scheffersomyces stipitis CBS 6054]ABN67543.1 predicted protein [Scheffersomyces stipitis CBS 6054]KAG2732469.1 hypothetical protein G9P44_004886 [Scheffersomyces stipitis]
MQSNIDYSKSSLLSPLESQVLTQYQFLNSQLITLNNEISKLTHKSKPEDTDEDTEEWSQTRSTGVGHLLLDNLRNLEMKIGLIHTLFKGAVYALFLEQDNADLGKQEDEDEEQEEEEEQEDSEGEVLDVDADVTRDHIEVE